MAMAPTPPNTSPMPPAGGAMMDPSAAMDGAESVVVTICREGDGSYRVYPGDEPDDAGGAPPDDMSEDDADAMGPAGGAPAGGAGVGGDMGAAAGGPGAGAMSGGGSGGVPADSIGAALKAALDILQSDKSNGPAGAGDADAQFAAGYSGDKSPTPAGLKYPPS